MIKKLLIFSLVFVGMFTLSACDKDDSADDLVKVGEAMEDLDIALEVSADITFVTTGLHDVEITWTSSDTDVIAIDGTVTRPLFTEGDANVTVTAYLSLGDQTLTKAFTVKVLKIANISEAEQVEEAKGSLLLTVADLVVSDITLPAEVVKDDFTATVTWASNNTTLVTDAGVVTRPAEGTANVLVTMTATVTVGAASSTKTFEVMIKAEETAASFTSIALLYAGSSLGDIVEYEGTVVALFDGGYFISDGTNSLGVYNPGSTTVVAVGDTVYVKGEYGVYNTLYQIKNVSVETVVNNTGTDTLTAVEKTVAEMLALDSSDKLIHGMPYTVMGTVEISGSYNNVYLVVGDDKILIYYNSLEASLDALEAEEGKDIIITVFYYTDHGTNGPMMVFDGLAADIDYRELTPAEKLAADIVAADSLVVNIAVASVTLPTVGPNGSTYGTWTSDTLGVFASDGTFVAVAGTTTTVTFTASVTQGALPAGTTTIEVVVPVLSTIEEALAMDKYDELEVTGVIYDVMYYGLFIEEDGYYIFVYGKDFIKDATVTVGDTITVRGYRGEYTGLAQINFVSFEKVDATEAVPTATVMSLGALSNGLVPKGTVATITATYTEVADGDYFDYILTDSAGNTFEIYYRSLVLDDDNVSELVGFDGKIITLDVIYYNNYNVLFIGVPADVTEETAFTDAQIAADIAAWIVIVNIDAAQADLTLPAAHDTLTSTITWETSAAGVITSAGEITRVIGTDTYAVLTATVTYEGIVVTRDIDVTVLDENYAVASITVTEALASVANVDGDGPDPDPIVVKGIVTSILGDDNVVLQDPAGGPGIIIYTNDFNIDNPTIAVGDEIIVRGIHENYYGLQELSSTEFIEVVSTGNNVITFTGVSVATIVADMDAEPYTFQGHNFELTGLIVEDLDAGYGYMLVKDALGNQLKFKYAQVPYAQDLWEVGDVVDLTVVVWEFYFGATRVYVTEYPELTDTDRLTAAGNGLSLPLSTIENLVLPIDEDYGVTVVWTSGNASYITDAGLVTRPAIGEDDVDVVMTATLSIGTETDVVLTYTVTVPALVPVLNELYSTGFESDEDFVASTTYNSTKIVGPALEEWKMFYGTPSTTGELDGLQSAHMRLYASAPGDIPYIESLFTFTNVDSVEFLAYSYAGVTLNVSYSIDGTTWIGTESFATNTTATIYTYNINYVGDVYLRFDYVADGSQVDKARLLIDNIVVYEIPVP